MEVFPYRSSTGLILASAGVLLACLLLLYRPVRERSSFLSTAYSAIDRPEDRPFTLIWIATQLAATYLVLIVMIAWLNRYDKTILISITVLIAAIGDGLAEPVGIRFGKRSYRVHALFTDKKYIRTLEGSMCVFLSAVLAVFLLAGHLNQVQLVLALLIIPITTTLAEAFSPHTWDGPFIYLAGGLSTVMVLELSRFSI